MSTYTFKWPKGPQEVILTGTFDNWSKSLPLVKQSDGSFELTVPLPADFETNRILYKYIVDGEWLVSATQRIGQDDAGIDNNVLEPKDIVSLQSAKGSVIPESGLLATSVPKESAPAEGDVKTTVLPKSEGQGVSILGEPGIFVPKGPEQLAAFETVEDVDSRNLTAAEKKKQKKKVKRSQYKAKKKKAAQEAAGTVGAAGAAGVAATGLTATSTGTEETESEEDKTEDPATAAAVAAVAAHDEKEDVVQVPVDKATEEQSGPAVTAISEPVVAPVVATSAEKAPVVDSTVEAEAPKTLDPKSETKPVVEEAFVAPLAAAPIAVTEAAAPVSKEAEVAVEKTPVVAPITNEEITPATAPIDPEPTIVDDVPAVAVAPVAEKEVDAAPIAKTTAPAVVGAAGAAGVVEGEESDEEILIAQGNGNKDDIEAAIVAQEGKDVTVEEIKPTQSEAARLTQEANISKKASASKINKPAATAAATKKETTAKDTKNTTKDKKKPNGFVRFFKKIFD